MFPGRVEAAALSLGTRRGDCWGARKHVSQGPREAPAVPSKLWMEGLKYCSFHRVKPGSLLSYSIISEVGQTPQNIQQTHETCLLFMALLLAGAGGEGAWEGRGGLLWLRCGPWDSASHRNHHPLHKPKPCLPGASCWAWSSGTGEETLTPAGALTPADRSKLDHRQDSLSQRSRVGASGLDSTARSPTPTRGSSFHPLQTGGLENWACGQRGDSEPRRSSRAAELRALPETPRLP